MTWIPSVSGAPIDLVDPSPAQVDFREIAWSLAHVNRYCGHPQKPVSVGLHTLIGLKLAPDALKGLWLLHDAHESRLGDTTSPMKEATIAVAMARFGEAVAEAIRTVRLDLEAAHDAAIHAAAGLALPTPAQKGALREIDNVALATERREFMAPSKRSWWIDEAGIKPARDEAKWMAPDRVADQIHAAFLRHLPALRGRSGRVAY